MWRSPRQDLGVLSTSRGVDKGNFPELKANYEQALYMVYAYFSAFFIRHHGPGFFLSLIKSPTRTPGIPSWAADWAVPWPNYNAVRSIDFAAGSSPAKDKNAGAEFDQENGCAVLKPLRPRILRVCFTRDRHVDDSDGTHLEGVQFLSDETLIEMHPGLAALLKMASITSSFASACTHSLGKA